MVVLSWMFVLRRSVYRTIELAGGWRGHIIRTQAYFSAFFSISPGLVLPTHVDATLSRRTRWRDDCSCYVYSQPLSSWLSSTLNLRGYVPPSRCRDANGITFEWEQTRGTEGGDFSCCLEDFCMNFYSV